MRFLNSKNKWPYFSIGENSFNLFLYVKSPNRIKFSLHFRVYRNKKNWIRILHAWCVVNTMVSRRYFSQKYIQKLKRFLVLKSTEIFVSITQCLLFFGAMVFKNICRTVHKKIPQGMSLCHKLRLIKSAWRPRKIENKLRLPRM